MNLWALDIETYTQGKRANDYTDTAPVKLGNVKDPVKVQAKLDSARADARGKHALNWWTGKIISLAVVEVNAHPDNQKWKAFYGHNEYQLLNDFVSWCTLEQRGIKFVGMHSNNFDYPFIVGRLMANKLKVPDVFKRKFHNHDVDEFFGWSAASGQRGKLAAYAHGLDLDSKTMSGSDVAGLYREIMEAHGKGEEGVEADLWEQLTTYNLMDSQIVANIARRYGLE